jgi:hypothetical protein
MKNDNNKPQKAGKMFPGAFQTNMKRELDFREKCGDDEDALRRRTLMWIVLQPKSQWNALQNHIQHNLLV